MNINKVHFAGRLTHKPEIKSTPSGMSVTSFSLASNYTWMDKDGKKQEKVEYGNVVVWGKLAEAIVQWCVKGQVLYVEGRLETRHWEDKDKIKHTKTEIIAGKFEFGARPKGQAEDSQESPQSEEVPIIDVDAENLKPEDLPF